jgi:hypothetical protein
VTPGRLVPRALHVASALALVALAGAAGAGDGRAAAKLALDPLDVRGVQRALAAAVEQKLCQALHERAPAADLVCPEDVAAAASIARQEVILGRCTSEECMKRVEDMRIAPRRVNGWIERDAKGIVLSVTLRDGEAPPRTVSERLPEDLDPLLARIPGIVEKLLP